jgi:hypothetical protein
MAIGYEDRRHPTMLAPLRDRTNALKLSDRCFLQSPLRYPSKLNSSEYTPTSPKPGA